MKIAIGWPLSSHTGWGVYGINIALEFAKRDIESLSTAVVRNDQVIVDPVRRLAIKEFTRRSNMQQLVPDDYVLLHSLGNDFLPVYNRPGIGVTFFEEPLSKEGVERAKKYDIIITGSTWNEETLRSHGLSSVRTLIQGVDRSLFYPAPKRLLFPGRFLIFSGGKAEPRKGQDIVVKAFRIFAKKHPEAMLVTAWHSPWPHLKKDMDLDLSEFGDRVIDVGKVPNGQMAPVYRECHVGLFPNRAEGGTNLVAMECVACGVPIIVSENTGHRDLIRLASMSCFPVGPTSVEGTPEPYLEEILHALERAFNGQIYTGPHCLPGWEYTADGLIAAAKEVQKGNEI